MISRFRRFFSAPIAMVLGLVLLSAAPSLGGVPSADWLPADVKFHFSIVDYPESKPLFDQTGLGQLLDDEAMRPFLHDIPNQLRSRARASWLGLMWVDLGVDWAQFATVPSGEVAWAVFEVEKSPASVLLADVTGKDKEVERLCKDIAAAMAKKNVLPKQLDMDGTAVTLYELPKRGEMEATTLIHFVRNGFFVATQHMELAKRIVPRAGAEQPDNLSGLTACKYVLGECREASKNDPHALLYLVPFDCMEMMHNVALQREVEVERSPEVYRSQGFDALSAIGATIVFKGEDSDFSFYVSLYAPKPWSKSMQMLDLRNGVLRMESWIDQKLSSCSLLNLHAKSVYGNLGPFFDEVVANGAIGTWDDILFDLREVEDGPRLDLEKEILAHLDGPVVVIENESLPVTPESPQVLMAIKSANEAALQAGLKKGLDNDPFILKKSIAGTKCYYSLSEDGKKQLLWIICVAQGHLFMANDFDILAPVLEQKTGPPLADDAAFQKSEASRKADLPTDASTVSFYRLDRWTEVRYELLRTGKKISSRRSLGGMLNSFLGGESMEDEEKPEIDGSKLPPFAQVRKYFGTVEAAAVTVEKGWLFSGYVRR